MRSFVAALLLIVLCRGMAAAQAPPVAPADLSRIPLASFRDDELDLPYYLANFARLANSVRMSGDARGFIDLPVWRAARDNKPYNARIMENILSLAFFYATNRPWNVYRGDPALRARLEAALAYWVSLQGPNGRFSEYAPGRYNLAATAFATKFMGESLRLLLRGGQPIDTSLLARVRDADRRAILAVLESPDLYAHGRRFSNQYTNVWAGGLAYLDLFPDPALRATLVRRIETSRADFQSPAGYWYEEDGADFGYDLGTHHSNLRMAWSYTRGTRLGESFVDEERRWYDWFGYNAAVEPGSTGFTLNRGIETRQQHAFVTGSGNAGDEAGNPLAERVVLARVLSPTREGLAAARAARRAELARTWPRVDSLRLGSFDAFGPYAFLHRSQVSWYPTEAQRQAALAELPYQARKRFTHQRADSRKPVAFTYVRRPAYYAAFNSGELWRAQQRYGLGLLWSRRTGALLQSQTGSDAAAWGTRPAGSAGVYEAHSIKADFQVGGRPIAPVPGARDLPDGTLTVRYPLGESGSKTLVFGDDAISVAVQHSGAFFEQLPLLLLPGDSLTVEPGRVMLRRGPTVTLLVTFEPASEPATEESGGPVGAKRVVVVRVPAQDRLSYSLTFPPPSSR